MQTINIEIPDNLNYQQEILLIAKHLSKKMLPAKNIKAIGNGYEIKQLQTTININRVSNEKVTVTYECPICKTIHDLKSSSKFFTNYGGKIRPFLTCSRNCSNKYMSILGENRCDFSQNELQMKQVRNLYNR